MPSLLGLPCARAPRPSAATCGPGQPVPGSCPASPSAAAGLAVPPAITLQSLRRRHRRQFCSPQPWQLRARASSIRRRRHLTPRAGQRHQPLTARPNRPSLVPSPPAPPIRSHPLLQPMQRQHHVRGLADWRTCSQPCLPLPTRLDRPAPPAVSNLEGMVGWTIVSRHPTATTPSSRNRSCDRARRLGLLLPNHQSSSLPPHPLPFSGPILWMFRPSSLPPPHTHTLPLSGLHQQSRRVSPPCTICSCVMKHDR